MVKQLLAKIHIAKKDLGLDEDTYRAVLQAQIGKDTCRGATANELERVLANFQSKGWKPKTRPQQKPHIRKIYALWLTLHRMGKVKNRDPGALRAFVKRMTGVESPEWLNSKETNNVIEALKKWAAR